MCVCVFVWFLRVLNVPRVATDKSFVCSHLRPSKLNGTKEKKNENIYLYLSNCLYRNTATGTQLSHTMANIVCQSTRSTIKSIMQYSDGSQIKKKEEKNNADCGYTQIIFNSELVWGWPVITSLIKMTNTTTSWINLVLRFACSCLNIEVASFRKAKDPQGRRWRRRMPWVWQWVKSCCQNTPSGLIRSSCLSVCVWVCAGMCECEWDLLANTGGKLAGNVQANGRRGRGVRGGGIG